MKLTKEKLEQIIREVLEEYSTPYPIKRDDEELDERDASELDKILAPEKKKQSKLDKVLAPEKKKQSKLDKILDKPDPKSEPLDVVRDIENIPKRDDEELEEQNRIYEALKSLWTK